jgi:hypothetical protein
MNMVAVARDFRAAKKQNTFGRIGSIGHFGFGRRVALWSMCDYETLLIAVYLLKFCILLDMKGAFL